MRNNSLKKWIYYKMEDCLWYLHDSTDVASEMKEAYEDTIIYLYDLAMRIYPEEKAYFESHKAFIMEGWIHAPDEDIIAEYELAIEYDKNLSSYYYHRLGQLYVKNQSDELYELCIERGIEVLLDDRPLRPGVMFSDMELIGIPHRIVLSERNLESNQFEYKGRRDESAQEVPFAELPAFLNQLFDPACDSK